MAGASLSPAKEGKYLIFALGHEDYGLEILKVREIIGWTESVPVPQVPAYVKGVINLRGKVIPVLDLKLKFGLAETPRTGETCIIIVSLDDVLIGIIIDKVREVIEIKQDHIEPAPDLGVDAAPEFILGLAKIGTAIKILLNIEKVLGKDTSIAKAVAGC